jgi:hypothetical protein
MKSLFREYLGLFLLLLAAGCANVRETPPPGLSAAVKSVSWDEVFLEAIQAWNSGQLLKYPYDGKPLEHNGRPNYSGDCAIIDMLYKNRLQKWQVDTVEAILVRNIYQDRDLDRTLNIFFRHFNYLLKDDALRNKLEGILPAYNAEHWKEELSLRTRYDIEKVNGEFLLRIQLAATCH